MESRLIVVEEKQRLLLWMKGSIQSATKASFKVLNFDSLREKRRRREGVYVLVEVENEKKASSFFFFALTNGPCF